MMAGEKRIKTATLNLRIDPEMKEGIEELARRSRRSVTSYIETLIARELEDDADFRAKAAASAKRKKR
jgi:predicted DNA-binding protein